MAKKKKYISKFKWKSIGEYIACKALPPNMIIDGFQYKLGLNVQEDGKGMYFNIPGGDYNLRQHNEGLFLDTDNLLAVFEMDDEDIIIADYDGFRTDKLVIKEVMKLSDVKTWEFLKEHGYEISYDESIEIDTRDNVEVLDYFIKNGAEIKIGGYDYYGRNIMYLAAKRGYLNILKYLQEQEMKITKDKDHMVSIAAMNGHLEIIKYFYEQNIEYPEEDEMHCALKLALDNRHFEVANFLQEQGADISKIDTEYYNSLKHILKCKD